MGLISADNPWVFISGLLGNISSLVVFLAPLPTFIRVCKKKSTEGFQSIPYVVSLFSAMLWIYYAYVKTGAFLLITINSFGCVIETLYIALYITYAPKEARIFTLRILLLLDFGVFCAVLLITHFLAKGSNRVQLLGWISVVFATSVFAAPLSIIRQVIRTKSVEFMPIPNVLGFIFGMLQMVLHAVYRKHKTVSEDVKLPEHSVDVTNVSTVTDSDDHRVPETVSSSEPPQVHDHRMIRMTCKSQNYQRDQREKIMDSPNPNPNLLGTCEA
ncbi:bidirectional sugar transporter SWEET12-like [Gossypium australe]|uniref:Bidirectional sugar transporter SWEET n=1 Tax=Gossypium australe TaxID=47621 RepID=A0A5B6W3V0_9ROSI|nr:bidirectional sugar transporter SWEET12-like [Gossypium australe]